MKTVLTIAGSDCSGGAGIQADLKTMSALGCYGMSAITSLTAQNTTGVYAISDVPADFVANQLTCIFEDIPPDAVKIGMVSNSGIIEVIAQELKNYRPKNIVLDPVTVSTSGSRLIDEQAVYTLIHTLMPLANVITPNIPEAEVLADMTISNAGDIRLAAEKIAEETGVSVLIKGGHLVETATDYL